MGNQKPLSYLKRLPSCLNFFTSYFFFFVAHQNGQQRRSEAGLSQLRQSREKRSEGARVGQQELDENGQGLRTLQQNVYFNRWRYYLPEVLRQQSQTHQFRRLSQDDRRIGRKIFKGDP